jgi:tetratricopeptide (TPR) repeat protein
MPHGVLGAVCLLVVGVYVYAAHTDVWETTSQSAADCYYNLLVQGFRAGHLNLKKDVPPGLTQLADPYDPVANALYRVAPYCLHDLSYYKGRLYLYFGVTPALILLGPFVALTGRYLLSGEATAIFCALGFLAGAGVLRALWRRYFPEVSVWVVATGTLALGLGTGVPVMLPRSGVYEVAVSCGYMLTMLSLGAIWCALHQPGRRCWWVAAASTAYGLALGARPSLLFGAVILLVPVIQARHERRPIWSSLGVAVGPILLIGSGLLLYNSLRFDSPFEFGQHYQLAAVRQDMLQHFSLGYLWFNFCVYFLEPMRWHGRFPFVSELILVPTQTGQGLPENPFGILMNIPVVWLALGVPLALRGRSTDAKFTLRGFLMAVLLLFGTATATLGLYYFASIRFEPEILPPLVLLAAVGILALDRALADRPVWRRAARGGWGLLLGFSVATSLFASIVRCAQTHNDLGAALLGQGKAQEAISQFEQALRLEPDCAEAHNNLGAVLLGQGRLTEAIGHYEQALRINPDYARAHNKLGIALAQTGRIEEAVAHYERALQIKPEYAEAHYNLAVALENTGRTDEAIDHYEKALRTDPDYVEAHVNLGSAFLRMGKVQEAIGQYELALRINPDYAEAHSNLGVVLQRLGKLPEAVAHYELAVRAKPDYVEARLNLGLALEKLGRTPEAIEQFEQALTLRPDFAPAKNALARLQAVPSSRP